MSVRAICRAPPRSLGLLPLAIRPRHLDLAPADADDRAGRRAMTSMSTFRTELEQAVNSRHSRMNPFTEKWVNGELTRTDLGQWVCQHYQYVGQFSQWCAAVYAGCPDPDARDFLLENIIEEESGVRRQPAADPHHAPAAHHARAHRVVLRDLPRALPHRGRRPPRRPRVAGPRHLQAEPAPAQAALRLHRPRGGILRDPHRGRRGP